MMILQQTRGNLSSGDQLALDLPFAATKSLTARVGPTPIFTRATGATYVGSDGLIHGVDTSTTSNSIGTGSKTFTLSAPAGQDQLWRTGDAVEATNGTNSMFGAVTSYDANTQVLVCNITSITGSGTFNSWRIGYRGPRFDHDPANPTVCRGLLIEEGRTNFITNSSAPNLWSSSNGTVTNQGSLTAPDGSTSGYNAGIGTANLDANTTSSQAAGTYAVSVFFKRDNADWVRIQMRHETNTNTLNAWFNLSTGQAGAVSIGAGTVTGGSSSIVPFGNGWYRCSVTGTTPTSGTLSFSIISATANNSVTRLSGSIYGIWGGQLEAGSFPTSYIPTTTGTVARSADVCSISGSDFTNFYNQPLGSVIINGDSWNGTAPAWCSFNVGPTGSGRTFEFVRSGSNLVHADSFAGNTTIISSPTFPNKFGFVRNQDNGFGAFNGVIVGATSTPQLATPNRLQLGLGTSSGAGYLNGCIRSFSYYKKRLPDAKLVTLTT